MVILMVWVVGVFVEVEETEWGMVTDTMVIEILYEGISRL